MSQNEHKVESYTTLVTIFVILMVLLVVTVTLAYVLEHALPANYRWVSTLVALTIACIKAFLVVLFFMHVRLSTRLTWVFAAAAFFWLGIMLVLSGADYFSRDALSHEPSQMPGQAMLDAAYGLEHQNPNPANLNPYKATPNFAAPTVQ